MKSQELPFEPLSDINYLALGDSYTIGESVSEEERFPAQLAAEEFNGNTGKILVDIIATTGWTTRDLLDAMDASPPEVGAYDFITLLIGVNNQYQGKPVQQYRDELKELIERSLEILNGDANKLILVSIPDYGVTPFAKGRDAEKIREEIDLYNDIKSAYAEKYGCPYVYITDLTRKAVNDPDLIASDGLHPSGKLYRSWIPRLKQVVSPIIKVE